MCKEFTVFRINEISREIYRGPGISLSSGLLSTSSTKANGSRGRVTVRVILETRPIDGVKLYYCTEEISEKNFGKSHLISGWDQARVTAPRFIATRRIRDMPPL